MRLLALLLALTLAPWAPAQNSDPAAPPSEAAIRVLGPGGVEAWYVPDPANPSRYIPHSGPAGIAETLESGWIGGPWGVALFLFGVAGQAMFMGRFALQWIASERQKKSVVPIGFWWLSLIGASMLLAYFVIRREPIGILGQSLGWPIYARNLWLISRDRRGHRQHPGDPATSPVPDPNAEP